MESLAIVRMNPMSNGHRYLIEEMLKVSSKIYIGLGSCQESRTVKNPFNKEERTAMIRNIFPDKEKVVLFYLNDLGDCSKKEWNDYCLKELHSQIGENANPTTYFGGCSADIEWWSEAVNLNSEPMSLIDVCRYDNEHISATEIRESLSEFLSGKEFSVKWGKHIPKENLEYVESNYPRELLRCGD